MFIIFPSVFIHNSRSENGRKTTASAPAVWRRISVAILTFIAGFPQTDFDTKLVNFFLELVLPVILKELKSNFSFLLYVYFKNCHINKLDNYFIYLVLAYFFRVFLVGVYIVITPILRASRQMPFRITTFCNLPEDGERLIQRKKNSKASF